jgi:cobalt-zinc-cadmium efflux system membrane fusion protein
MSKKRAIALAAFALAVSGLWLVAACDSDRHGAAHDHDAHDEHDEHEEAARGPHGGRWLADGDLTLELTIFEAGVEPEFRAFVYRGDSPIDPAGVSLTVELERLGGTVDRFTFVPRDGYLLGNGVVHEPHSFVVRIDARHDGHGHRFSYDSFEGRTSISAAAATAAGIETSASGPATIRRTLTLHGLVVPDPSRVFRIHARFPGVVKEVRKRLGDAVAANETLAVIEANESLEPYRVVAPAPGVVIERAVNPGMVVADGALFTVGDLSTVWVELAAFQHDVGDVTTGQPVTVRDVDGHQSAQGVVDTIAPIGSPASQSMTARVVLPNPDGVWRPGLFVTGEVVVTKVDVPLAVRRSALQRFRDWTVVFEQFGNEYEVRPVTLGRSDAEWVEIVDGLAPGARYVTTGSYVVKADIEKSGATHDH